MDVIIPPYAWFIAEFDKAGLGNCWSGSCGTDGSEGSFHKALFEYTVHIRRDEEKKLTFTASHWIRPAFPETLSPEAVEARTFPGTQEGLAEIFTWLTQAQMASRM
jgi:hypothetical protein